MCACVHACVCVCVRVCVCVCACVCVCSVGADKTARITGWSELLLLACNKVGFSGYEPHIDVISIFFVSVYLGHTISTVNLKKENWKFWGISTIHYAVYVYLVLSMRRTQQPLPRLAGEPVHPHSLVWALVARRCDTYHSLMRWLKWLQVWVVRRHSLSVPLKNCMCIMHVCALARNMEN